MSMLGTFVAPRYQPWFRRGFAAGASCGAVVAAWLIWRFTAGVPPGTADTAEALGLLTMLLGFPLSMLTDVAFAVHPRVGRAMLFLSIPVTWGLVCAAVSTIGALLLASPREPEPSAAGAPASPAPRAATEEAPEA